MPLFDKLAGWAAWFCY